MYKKGHLGIKLNLKIFLVKGVIIIKKLTGK